ncbi:MAG: efflux RND transporter permease subunit [Candidatus Eremiobacteraeota bacterium]|nr:efflux RND transporter permease subunit [Candidatus Eremiobacteraeota bacterium]
MNISAWAIRNPIPSLVLFLVLTIAGLASFAGLGIDENPNIDLPLVSVSITQIGAAPSELETQVTRKVEDSISGISGVKHITSAVNEGLSATTVEFELGTDTDRAVNDVRDAVSRIRQQLPGQINEPQITRVDFIGGPLATYTIARKGASLSELSWEIDNAISRSLLAVRGVGQVQRSGGVDREIRINLDPEKMDAYGVTADAVNLQVRALNIDMPGGRSTVGGQEESIRTLGSAPTLEKLGQTRIASPRGGWVQLDQLGTIENGFSEPRQRALLNGESVVAFQVVRATGSNLVDVANRVDKALEKMQSTLPAGTVIKKVRTNATYVLESYEASIEHLCLGAGLAVIVIYWFLRDWRAAAISALAMPLSVIPTFFVMKAVGFTLNNMSLLGLALVIGILVDDAIVEIENIVRHIQMGKDPYHAALEAADEIGLAVVATTASIIVVFVPVAFMGGIPGQFFRQFGLTVAVAVFFSLVVARLLTPMMAAYWMVDIPPHEEKKSWLTAGYDKILGWALAYRVPTLILAVTFFVFSMALFGMIPKNLIGTVDRGETVLTAELPPGANIETTTAVSKELTRILLSHKEVKQVFTSVGTPSQNGPGGRGTQGAVNKSSLYIVLVPRKDRKISQSQFEEQVAPELQKVPGVRLSFGAAVGLSGRLTLVLSSENGPELTETAQKLLVAMRGMEGLYDINTSAALQRPEILVKPNFDLAAEQGVSVSSIARTALVATLGDNDQNLAKFDLSDRQINIRVQIDPRYRDDLATIRNLKVMASGNRLLPISSVASLEMGQGPSQIDRYDRKRKVSIEAAMRRGYALGDALNDIHKLQAFKELPKSVSESPAGDVEIQKDIFNGFAGAMGAAVLMIYAVMVLLFSGFVHPLTIMVALPLSIGGAVMGLLVTREPMGMYALIGIVMLMGLATKNSILLVEYVLTSKAQGMERMAAIFESGEARMRPILMTTVAMIAGMLPIALGIGAGAEVRKSMAIAVIGGLTTSTLLTLVVVPVVFSLLDEMLDWFWKKKK